VSLGQAKFGVHNMMIVVVKRGPFFLDFKKVLVILTDGQSNSGQVGWPARQLKNSGVVIFSVGIGEISRQELETMASYPINEHVFTLDNFSQLSWLAGRMSSQTCNGMIVLLLCL
jgi:hypothetical protein